MKISYDKNGRKIYKFNHSICQGGYLYTHKSEENSNINNKEALRAKLNEICTKFELIDATIKIYDNIFFLFFMTKPSLSPLTLITAIQQEIELFGTWEEKYIWAGIYDLQEKYLKEYLYKIGFDYGKG